VPDCIRALCIAGMLCLPLVHAVCQDDPDGPVAAHARLVAEDPKSSLAHYRLAEVYLRENNYQSAANEFREALSGDQEPVWTNVWSHIQLARIFDVTGQHDRAVNEYRQAQRTGDNTDGALDQANNYLKRAENGNYVPRPQRLLVNGIPIVPIQKTDPEYTEQARLAELEGTVLLRGTIGEDGFAHDLEVTEPVGLGLDEKAMEAVKQWHYQLTVTTGQIAVDFRLSTKQSRWHLIRVQFDTPPGTSRPVFTNALYPIGAGLGPEAIEEGTLVVAMGRLATAKLTFDVDEQGVPVHFQVPNSSEAVWGSEATAIVGQWRFTPGMKNGIAVAVSCTVELVWGERELNDPMLAQVRQAMAEQTAASSDIVPRSTAGPSGTEATRIAVDAQAQASKLVIRIPPEYPSAASVSGLRGTVRLRVLIGIDGRVRQAEVMDGDPGLIQAAAESVKQWVYQPTLLNGPPVEVTFEADVDVGPSR
jgi:TonB family protein